MYECIIICPFTCWHLNFSSSFLLSFKVPMNILAVWKFPKITARFGDSQDSASVQFIHSVVSDSLQPNGQQHTRLPCPSPTISSSVVPFSTCLQSFPASGSFPMSQFFVSGGQSIGVSASASVLPMNIQDWFTLGLTGWISLQSKGLSRVFRQSN